MCLILSRKCMWFKTQCNTLNKARPQKKYQFNFTDYKKTKGNVKENEIYCMICNLCITLRKGR